MTLYLDSSALLKRYLDEPDRDSYNAILERLADLTGAWTLDTLHLAAVQRSGPSGITAVAADLRQAEAARSLGWPVLGV